MPTILIGADICPIEGNQSFFEKGDAKALFNDLLEEFEQADLVMANLECPLIEKSTPILKTGPVFGAPPSCINGIKQAGIDILGLANNHIMDHGVEGLTTTLSTCTKAGIATVGSGQNLEAARRIWVRELAGIKLGILAMAEHEFSIASKKSPGANPLEVIDFVRNVTRNRQSFDYLIVLLHGGDEFQVPTPRLQETCRFLIETGARAVIVQHPHILGGYEDYLGGHIVYGQGALVMDEAIYRDRHSFHEGFLVKLRITADKSSAMEIVPFIQSNPAPGARRMTPANEQEFRHRLSQRSANIQSDSFVLDEWLKFCDERKHAYVSSMLGHNRVLSRLNVRGSVARMLCSKTDLLRARNIVCCETHREAVETIFNHQLL